MRLVLILAGVWCVAGILVSWFHLPGWLPGAIVGLLVGVAGWKGVGWILR